MVTGSIEIDKDVTLYSPIHAPNGLAIELGDGKSFAINDNHQSPQLTVDQNGTHTKSLQTDKLAISQSSSGKATIDTGATQITVNSSAVIATSQIQISFESNYSPATRYWIDQKTPGKSFRINLDQ